MNVKLQHSRRPTIYTHRFRLCRTLICAGISIQRSNTKIYSYLFVYMYIYPCDSPRTYPWTKCWRFSPSILKVCWMTWSARATLLSDNATTFRSSSKEIQSWSIHCSPDSKCFIIWQTEILKVYCSQGSMVGRVLGENGPDCEVFIEKGCWLSCIKIWWNEYAAHWDWIYY